MRKKITLSLLLMSPFIVFAQGKDTIPPLDTVIAKLTPTYFEAIRSGVFELEKDTTWKDLQICETDAYSLKIPSRWLKLGTFGSLIDQSFDASELYFKDTFNARPVLTGLFILNQPASGLDDAKTSCLKGYRSNPDRVFEETYIDTAQRVTLSSGQEAYLLHTRFFRKSNQFYQSRYDLVVFSEKKQQGYLIMLSVQYNDSTYNFEAANNLLGFAKKAFSNFILK